MDFNSTEELITPTPHARLHHGGGGGSKGSRAQRFLRRVRNSLGPQVLLAAFVVICMAVVATVLPVRQMLLSDLEDKERDQAVRDVRMANLALKAQFDRISVSLDSWRFWTEMYDYLEGGDPSVAVLYDDSYMIEFDLTTFSLYNASGDWFNGITHLEDGTEGGMAIPNVSVAFRETIGDSLKRYGNVKGLFYDAVYDRLDLVMSGLVKRDDASGGVVGWCVLSRVISKLLPSVAETAGLCLASYGADEVDTVDSAIRDMWDKAEPHDGIVSGVVSHEAASSVFGHLRCNVDNNVSETDEPLLASTSVLLDNLGDKRSFLVVLRERTYEPIASSRDRVESTGKVEFHKITYAVNHLLDKLEAETERTNVILQNIFPKAVLDKIKNGETGDDFYTDTAVLMVDITNFTLWSSGMSPQGVIDFLNNLYSEMDATTSEYGATKVRTIGDAYIVASGIPNPNPESAYICATMAIHFCNFCHGKLMPGSSQPLQIRSGIGYGTCSGAIVGTQKKTYEIWGESAKLAQSLQESSVPMQILCSEGIYNKLDGKFEFGPKTEVEYKSETLDAYPLQYTVSEEARAGGVVGRDHSSNLKDLVETTTEGDAASFSASASYSRLPESVLHKGTGHRLRYLAGKYTTSSLRFIFSAGILAIVAMAISAIVIVLSVVIHAANKEIVQMDAETDMSRLAELLSSSMQNLRDTGTTWAEWDSTNEYLMAGDPWGPYWFEHLGNDFWLDYQTIDGILFFYNNGTLLNSRGYDYPHKLARNLTASEVAEVTRLVANATGSMRDITDRYRMGLLKDSKLGYTRIFAAVAIRNLTGSYTTGWVVLLQDVKTVLPSWATFSNTCLGALQSRAEAPGDLREAWDASMRPSTFIQVRDGEVITRHVHVTVAKVDAPRKQMLSAGTMICENDIGNPWVAEGSVFGDVFGRPGLFVFVAKDTGVYDTERTLIIVLCVVCAVVMVVVFGVITTVVELLVFRRVNSLSGAIASVMKRRGDSLKVSYTGANELKKISQSVNFLLGAVARENKKSRSLLSSLFPEHVLAALRSGHLTSDNYAVTSILFSEIVGFTKWASVAPPKEVAPFLNELIGELEDIARSFQLMKVKTILDLFMAATGIPEQSSDSAHTMLRAALAFRSHLMTKTLNGEPMGVRIGVSTGPVCGGVVGKRQWAYDVWSDTVNLAARLKASADPGMIQCCDRTFSTTSELFDYDAPAEVSLKGKGVQIVHALLHEREKQTN
eukprot:m51a1_g7284 putative adenylate guanylate cyclase catalytic domain protein (1235) ;mRNA; r:28362-33495